MNRFLLLLALLPTLLLGAGGIQTDAHTGSKFLYSQKYARKFFLGLNTHPKRTSAPSKVFLEADVKVPNDFSWKDLKGLPPGFPLDQGQCGSCVVNSIIGNVTFNEFIRGLLPDGQGPLSRGQVMNCNPSAGQCSGDYAENVGGWVVKHGGKLLSEKTYPYSPNDGSCQNISGTEYSEGYAIPSGSVVDNSEESIGKGLVISGPLSTTVGADSSWMNAGTGLYTSCTSQGTNHEVLIIGIHARNAARGNDGFINFAAAKSGDISIDILNSWGGQWADSGIIHTLVHSTSGRLCNNVTEEVYAFKFPALEKAVDGGWSPFGSCLNNVQTRTCTNPSPANGGKMCEGSNVQNCVMPSGGGNLMLWLAISAVVAALIGGLVLGRRTKPAVLSKK